MKILKLPIKDPTRIAGILLPIVFVGLLTSLTLSQCNIPLDSTALYRYSTQGKYVLYGPDTVAVLTSVEYSWERNRRIKELTFKIIDNNAQIDIDELLRYLSRERSGWEIELNFDIE